MDVASLWALFLAKATDCNLKPITYLLWWGTGWESSDHKAPEHLYFCVRVGVLLHCWFSTEALQVGFGGLVVYSFSQWQYPGIIWLQLVIPLNLIKDVGIQNIYILIPMIKAHLENCARVWVPDYKENVDAMEYVQDEGDQDAEFIVCLATPSWEEGGKKSMGPLDS